MADPGTWKPGNPGDLQPWRTRRGSSGFPAVSTCDRYALWVGDNSVFMERNTTAAGYGYPPETCIMCGHPRLDHELERFATSANTVPDRSKQ